MLGFVAAALVVATSPTFVTKPCNEASLTPRAICGTVTVPEDRSRKSGRRIGLNLVIIPAAKHTAARQALFDLEGGPGLADTKNAGFYLTDGKAYAESRDIVLVDQRGTGGSNPLDCPEFDAADRALQPMFPASAVRSCRARLSQTADLKRYTTDDAVADLEDVRRALGYAKIDLSALSYGTTLALRYVRSHEDRVRSVVLLSAVPPSAMPPRHHATAAQAALDQLIADCAADGPCSLRYPRLTATLDEALRQVRASRSVTSGVAMERLRTKLYSPGGARTVPSLLSRLAAGDFAVLSSSNERAGFNYFDGVYLTITCSESMPWFNQRQTLKAAQGTRFGDYRLARQSQACAHWPRAQVKADFFKPVRAQVPILFISGARDPVTPAKWAEDAARSLPNARLVVIPWAGHIVDGLTGFEDCFDPQVQRFLDTADPSAVDALCFATMMPPPFKT